MTARERGRTRALFLWALLGAGGAAVPVLALRPAPPAEVEDGPAAEVASPPAPTVPAAISVPAAVVQVTATAPAPRPVPPAPPAPTLEERLRGMVVG